MKGSIDYIKILTQLLEESADARLLRDENECENSQNCEAEELSSFVCDLPFQLEADANLKSEPQFSIRDNIYNNTFMREDNLPCFSKIL